jgi:hypothetical protein
MTQLKKTQNVRANETKSVKEGRRIVLGYRLA